MDNPNLGKFWKIICQDEWAGYIFLTMGFSFEHGKDAFIDELYLKPEFRKRGTGSIILDLITLKSRDLGVKVIHLEVEPDNSLVAHLYRKVGFKSNGRMLMSKKFG